MGQVVFKGSISAGTISSTFQSDFSNIDSDLLIQEYVTIPGGEVTIDHDAIAPGGSATLKFKAEEKGMLKVDVVPGHDEESGRLIVRTGKKVMHDEPIKGPVRWVYAVAVKE